ncbi:hypothetical protein [Thalassotalea sp. G20_0]|uniref:hypothetical protein n=1 Tax=Thalassotalea sp. G20_0 TaxID=2821093 RepID=UPI00256FD56D|nr:hypothetical protein [Thalassotalea sp. G20_0]
MEINMVLGKAPTPEQIETLGKISVLSRSGLDVQERQFASIPAQAHSNNPTYQGSRGFKSAQSGPAGLLGTATSAKTAERILL